MTTLSGKNLELFAAQHYRNRSCIDYEEFLDDLSRFKYVKRLLRRYTRTGDIETRLVLNHIILIYNVFTIPGANTIFSAKIEYRELPALKSFLSFLNYLPKDCLGNIQPDLNIVNHLKKL